MTTTAIVMFIIFAVILWGGLMLSLINLLRHPEGSVQLLDDNGNPVERPAP